VFFPQDTDGLNLDETTLADLLKAGTTKRSALVNGIWAARGISATSRASTNTSASLQQRHDSRVLMHNTEVVEQAADLDTLTSRYTEQAIRFIHESRAAPFFLYMPHTFRIFARASARFRGKSSEGLYGDVVEELDWSVARSARP